MNEENIPTDLVSFLPSFWTSALHNIPILGLKYDIIDLDENFIEFLTSDGFILDEDRYFVSEFSSSDEEFSDNDSKEASEYLKPSEKFPELHEKIKLALKNLGGSVVPKLNWTVPKDSIWISANTLKCTSTNEVYQLLKASDRIQSDIELLKFVDAIPQLFLRSYIEIRHENEFRVFVINGDLIAVTQRNLDLFNPSLAHESQKIIDKIAGFFREYFINFKILTYSFDVYISDGEGEVFLIDINPLLKSSSTGLFKYHELEQNMDQNNGILFRYIKNEEDCIIGACERNFLPVDLLNVNSNVNTIDFNRLI